MLCLRSLVAAFVLAVGLVSPHPVLAECVKIGNTCIKTNKFKATIRIGSATPDLSELENHTNLRELTLLAELGFDQPVDLSRLRDHPSLEKLALVGLRVQDISPITEMKGVKRLSLDSVQAPDFAPLADMHGLEHLSVWNIAAITDLEFARGLTRLQSLNIADTAISDLSPLENLKDLEILLAFNSAVDDLSPLSGANLRVAWLSNCPVTSVAPLAGSTRLEMLRADGTRLQNLDGLQGKINLQTLILSGTGISDLSPIADAANLHELALDGTAVQDLRPLSGLRGLTKLTLAKTPVTNIDALAYSGLRELALDHSALASLSGVQHMSELTDLSLSGTAITDLTQLRALTKLAILRAIGLPEQSLKPLADVESLRIIFTGPNDDAKKRLLGREKIVQYLAALP